jgi:hypothetical protein
MFILPIISSGEGMVAADITLLAERPTLLRTSYRTNPDTPPGTKAANGVLAPYD